MLVASNARRGVAVAAVSFVALLSGCRLSSMLAPLHKQTRTVIVAHVPASPLRVETANGSITATRSELSEVQVVAHLSAVSEERLRAAEVVTERADDGTLSVHVNWPDGRPRSREGCSFEVLLPDAVDVYFHSSNGKLSVEGLGGQAELHTSNGRIEVRDHSGAVTANTSNGAIDCEQVWGPVELESSNGKIQVADAPGLVSAHTSNGAIQISLAAEGTGPIDARTSNGSLTLELGPAFVGELSAKTSNGLVRIDQLPGARITRQEKSSAVVVFGNSEQKSTVTTTNGTVRIKRAESALNEAA